MSFSTWLISFSIMPSQSFHVVASSKISLFMADFLIHSSTDGHVSCFRILAVLVCLLSVRPLILFLLYPCLCLVHHWCLTSICQMSVDWRLRWTLLLCCHPTPKKKGGTLAETSSYMVWSLLPVTFFFHFFTLKLFLRVIITINEL